MNPDSDNAESPINKSKIMESILELPDLLQRKARNAYEEFIQEGMEKDMEKGRKEGVRLALIQRVKGFYLNGASLESIARSLQLSIDQVEAILKEEAS